VRYAWLVIRKDLRTGLRRPQALLSMLFFGFLLLVILNVAVPAGTAVAPETGAGILWVAITFAAVLGLGRTVAQEKENRCLEGLLLSPLSPEALFGAKMTVNFLLICLAQAAILPLFFILYGDGFLRGIPMLLLVLLTANAGFAATGTLCSAITAGTGRNEALLPMLFFPLVMPLIAMAVKVSGMIFAAEEPARYSSWLQVMAAFACIFTGLGFLVTGRVIRD